MKRAIGFTRLVTAGRRHSGLPVHGPAQASGFSAHPKFQEAINFLDDVHLRLARLSRGAGGKAVDGGTADGPSGAIQWLSAGQMSERVGFSVLPEQHREIVRRLDLLGPYATGAMPEIVDLLSCFTASRLPARTGEGGDRLAATHRPDGCPPALPGDTAIRDDPAGHSGLLAGSRKTARAMLHLEEGSDGAESGDFQVSLVNGLPLHRFFHRPRDLHAVAEPLKLTDRLGRYRFAAVVSGGGPTGQAGAVRLALARALSRAEPGLAGSLAAAGMLTRDPRAVERKKPGQEKARKKFAWVKR